MKRENKKKKRFFVNEVEHPGRIYVFSNVQVLITGKIKDDTYSFGRGMVPRCTLYSKLDFLNRSGSPKKNWKEIPEEEASLYLSLFD